MDRQSRIIVVCLAIECSIVFGTTMCALGLFIDPVLNEFRSSTEVVSASITGFLLAMTVAMPVVGFLLDRISAHRVMIFGVSILAGGYLLASSSRSVGIYSAAVALSGAGLAASSYVPCMVVISHRILHQRGLAFGILLAGCSIGAAVFPLILTYVIKLWGWRYTMTGISAFVFITTVPLICGVARLPSARTKPSQQRGSSAEYLSVIKTRSFWLITIMQIFAGTATIGPYFFLVRYLIDSGFSKEISAMIFGTVGVSAAAGYLVFGLLADRISARNSLLIGLIVNVIGTFLLMIIGTNTAYAGIGVLAVIIWGSTMNVASQLAPILLAELASSHSFGKILGVSNLIAGLPCAFGPVTTGLVYDLTKSYVAAFLFCAGLMMCAVISSIIIKPRQQYLSLEAS